MIDPQKPDFSNTPACPSRPDFDYAPRRVLTPPLVSIVTPYFNVGAVFHETARSILRQSLQQWEWLILNDASTDAEALAVLDEYRDRDPRIRVIDLEENQGPGGVRNLGFQQSRADYVFTVDADDLLEPTTLEKTLWHLVTHPDVGFVQGFTVGFGAEEYLWRRGFHDGAGFLKGNLVSGRAMIRKSAHARAGGYDASMREGFEDWDFWMRCANAGIWGWTIPEYLDWYRRRENHADAWADWDEGDRQKFFRDGFAQKYPRLFAGEFPELSRHVPQPFDSVRADPPFENPLDKTRPRLLMILPWLATGGADKFNLELLQLIAERGWEVSIATTLPGAQSWLADFARFTPDVFVLEHFLRRVDHPCFLRYLIQSRRPDVVMISNSEAAYLHLPYLRAHCPEPAYVDYCHMEEAYWKNGGYPRYAVGAQPLLDLNIVSSNHLKQWMVDRGAEASRIEVAHTNIDPEKWKRDPEARRRVRERHGIEDDVVTLLYAGRICPQKQPRVFGPVMAELARRGLKFRAFVAGDGEDRGWLEAYIREHGAENQVIFLGPVPNDEVRDFMSASDIYFMPSLWEGIALSNFEAMSMELAVVGAIVGGQLELVTPECGILLERADEETEIRRYSERLAGLIADPLQCLEMGRRARQRITEHFQLEAMADTMISHFETARQLKSRDPRPLIPARMALESTTQAVEFQRVSDVADQLWRERESWRSSGENGPPVAPEREARLSPPLEEELRLIENSKSWRLYRAAMRSPLRWLAGSGARSDWEKFAAETDPQRRLARLCSSRYYRSLLALRRGRAYRVFKTLTR